MSQGLFAAIEAVEFSARVNAASGYNSFVRAVGSQPEFEALRSEVSADGVLHRVLSLVAAHRDPAYENPHDAALAAYLLLLGDTDAGRSAAGAVLSCDGCWWARKVAEKLRVAEATEPAAARR